MENTKKKYSSQTILDKIENLMGEDSFVLALLKDKKLSAIDLKDKNEEKIKSKNLKIDELKKLVNDLQNEANKINDIFKMYKTADFKTLIDVLGLNIHFDEDAKVVEEKLPEIVQEKEKKIEELSKDVSTLETDVNSLVSRVTDIDKEYKDAKSFQSELIKLVKDSVDGKLNKTRDEVIKVLKDASFEENEAIEAAKLILFPEDELIPFFAENKVLEEVQKSIDNITIDLDSDEESTDTDSSSDIAPSILPEEEKDAPIELSELNLDLTSKDEKEEFSKEPDTPISINELQESFLNLNEDKEEPAISEEPDTTSIFSDNEINYEFTAQDKEIDINKILDKLGKNHDDAQYISNLFVDVKEEDLDNFIKEIGSLDISIGSVPLLAYKHDLNNYLNNIKTLKDNGYKLTDMDIEKFSAVLYLINNNDLIANLVILKKYKINLLKTNGKICFKLLSLDTSKLIDNLNLLVETGDIEVVRTNVEVITKNVKDICERILFCKTNSIPYVEENGRHFMFRSFIYDQKILEDLLETPLDLNNIREAKDVNATLKEIANEKLVDILDNSTDYNPSLESEKQEKEFNRIIKRLEDKAVVEDEYYALGNLLFSKNNTLRNIINILNKDSNAEIKDILIVSLLYNSHKDINSCQSVINTFNN